MKSWNIKCKFFVNYDKDFLIKPIDISHIESKLHHSKSFGVINMVLFRMLWQNITNYNTLNDIYLYNIVWTYEFDAF